MFLLLPLSVLADNNVITMYATFDNDIDQNLFNKIYVDYTDRSETEYSAILKKEENYTYTNNLYDGTDILKVKASLEVDGYESETSVVKKENGYEINVHIIKKEVSEDIVIGTDVPTTTTTTTPTTPVLNTSTTTININSYTNPTTTTTHLVEEDDDFFVRIVFIISISILGIFVLLFIIYATIKIVNANK